MVVKPDSVQAALNSINLIGITPQTSVKAILRDIGPEASIYSARVHKNLNSLDEGRSTQFVANQMKSHLLD